ncbi:hypothetical protein, partial [Acetobacter oeni]|uniref:hypothetical protein n=1 Tax=Acetobacter oeni TaxID=304077 RepID=UPI001C9939F8
LKIHSPGKGFELIAQPAQASQALFNIKKPDCFMSAPPIKTGGMESQRAAQNHGFFEPSIWD